MALDKLGGNSFNTGAIANSLGYTPANKAGDTFTGQITFQGLSTQYPAAVLVPASTHATSRRAGVTLDDWTVAQDTAGSGVRDFGIYNGTLGGWPIKANSSGQVTLPYQPAFRALLGTTVNASGSITPSYSVEVFDRGSNYDPSTSTFTAPVDGVYSFSCGMGIQGATTASTFMVIEPVINGVLSNGTTGWSTAGFVNTSSNEGGLNISLIIKLYKNDTIKLQLYATSTINLSNTAGWPQSRNYFSGHLIG